MGSVTGMPLMTGMILVVHFADVLGKLLSGAVKTALLNRAA